MYKRLDLSQLEGLGFTQDTLDFMQTSFRDTFGAVASLFGDYVIVTGVADLGANWGNGWVAINGELLPFVGGLKAPRIIIEEVVTTEDFADGSEKDVYYVRTAKLAAVGGTAFASFVRLSTIEDIMASIATETANRIASVNAEATTRSEYDALEVALRTAADAVLQANINAEAATRAAADTAEAAARAAADTALDTAKVNKAGDTMTGVLIVPGVNTDGRVVRTKILDIGDWDMLADSTKSVAHGIADFKKIRSMKGMIRNDADTAYISFPRLDPSLVADFGMDFIRFDGIAGANINLRRAENGDYESAAYDSTGYNRGWIVIEYEV